MIKIKGQYNSLKIFANDIDIKTGEQLIKLLNSKFIEESIIRIMPDCHSGIGCVIGTTMTIKDKVCPNLVGVDIGCGVSAFPLKNKEIDLAKIDNYINLNIPSGMNKNNKIDDIYKHDKSGFVKNLFNQATDYLNEIKAPINIKNSQLSLGTLGGGNHFIEIDKDDNNNYYLLIHTGSRHLGVEVCNYYQKLAYQTLSNNNQKEKIIKKLKKEGREKDIEKELKKIKPIKINKELAYLTGNNLKKYLNDMDYTQKYALLNRIIIADKIINSCGLELDLSKNTIESIHNYIDLKKMILRKGAISAELNEQVIIPLNMAEGAIIGVGRGAPDWNYSAPHGAGRIMSRKQAKESITLSNFKEKMENIYSTSITETTIDEAPQAYKKSEEIKKLINPTIQIKKQIKPVYNYKAH